jgi:hypothetical protein
MRFNFAHFKRPLSALIAVLIVFPATLSLMAMYMVAGQITGVIYRDFNANGQRELTNTYREPGVPGVVVTAYGPNGNVAATATTNADGIYSLTSVEDGVDYRVEFSNLQAGDQYGALGAQSNSSVQFVKGGAENINLGINYPAQYSNNRNPKVITSGFIAGNNTGDNAGYNASNLWTIPYDANGNQYAAGSERGNIGQARQIGSVWGLAYAKRSKKVYVASFTKRHAGFGPLGPGGIYEVTLNNAQTSGTTNTFYDFADNLVGPVSGGTSIIHSSLPNNPGDASRDDNAFDNVGKSSLGDIAISDDEKDLYAVNLYNRKLYKFDIATKSITGSWDITPPTVTPTPSGGVTWRPFALKFYRGKLYVGVTVTNEGSYIGAESAKGSNVGMQGIVYEFNGAGNFTSVLTIPFNYKKQPTGADLSENDEAAVNRGTNWRPWTSSFRIDRDNPDTYSQPWLTDIEFDVNGEMILGVRDRWGDQIGNANYRPTGSAGGTNLFSGIAPGEILRAGKVSLAQNSWQIESRGAVTHLGVTTATSNNQKRQFGPGGEGRNNYRTSASPTVAINSATYFQRIINAGVEGKYYYGDVVGVGGNHGSSSLGGLALLPGNGKVIMTAMDPTDQFNTGGLKRLHNGSDFYNNRTVASNPNNPTPANPGAADDNQDSNGTGNAPGATGAGTYKGAVLYNPSVFNWGKANGMGDVELLTDAAPIEIGNRVWRDVDGDGIQDAGEEAIAGVTVELRTEGGVLVATAVTNANGNYVFSSDPNRTSTTSSRFNLALVYGGNYKVRIPNTSGGSKQTSLGTNRLTKADQTSGSAGFNDERDSDGRLVEGQTYSETAVFALGDAGENNHSYDFGFAPLGALGDHAWIDANGNGIQEDTEVGVNGLTVTLYKLNQTNSQFEAYGTPQLTRDNPNEQGKKGYYWFEDLESGSYKVCFTNLPAGYEGYGFTLTEAGNDRTKDSNAGSDGCTGTIIINTTAAITSIDRVNPTIDAGIRPVGALGDHVWVDANGNGIQDLTEVGVNGVTVTLYKENETNSEFVAYGTPQQTRANPADGTKNGYYWFDNLPSGNYQVCFTSLPAGYEGYGFTLPGAGTDRTNDSNAGTDGCTGTITINTDAAITSIDRVNPTIDAGITPVGALGDHVWVDANGNGIQDPTEVGVNGVTVTLYKQNETNSEFVAYGTPQQTRANPADGTKNGYYWFDDLPSGNYQVCFTSLPAGYEGYGFTLPGAGTDRTNDSNAGTDGCTGTITINTDAGITSIDRVNPTIDAGITPVGSLGNFVWFDANTNGQQDSGEIGVEDVQVSLYKLNTDSRIYELQSTTLTGANGLYEFNGLLSGTYQVQFVAPNNYDFTYYQRVGVDATENSDATLTPSDRYGWTEDIVINTGLAISDIGRNNPTIDAGLVTKGALPVTLVRFDAVKEGGTTQLKWTTTSELNSQHFEVQRSADGKVWITLGRVATTGGEGITEQYTFTDAQPLAELNYYRLKAVDLDGSYQFSRINSVRFKGENVTAYVYPNPTSSSIQFGGSIEAQNVTNVRIINLTGTTVYESKTLEASGISSKGFKSGMYVVQLTTKDGAVHVLKVVIQPSEKE